MVNEQPKKPGILWLLCLGLCGFLAGFLGPVLLNPEANQGPLVGIFISGPLGVFLGGALWMISSIMKLSASTQRRILILSSAIGVLVTLCAVLPSPALQGYLLEVQVQKCRRPIEVLPQVIANWEKSLKRVTWTSPRPNWQEDIRKALEGDPGVVLDVLVTKKNVIKKGRKPWNRGKVVESGWMQDDETRSYYVKEGSCGTLSPGLRFRTFLPIYSPEAIRAPETWPPREVEKFIEMPSPQAVPAEYRDL